MLMKFPGISNGIRWCEVIALSDDKMLFIDPQKQVIGILRSTTTISMKPISYLLVPIIISVLLIHLRIYYIQKQLSLIILEILMGQANMSVKMLLQSFGGKYLLLV